jgi:hypothetical protein
MSEWQPAPLQEMNMDLEEMIGRAADRASDVGLLPDESYEDFDSRRAVAIGKAVLSCLEENGMGELAKLERLVRIADEALRQAPFECGEKWRKEYTDYLTNKAMAELAAAPKQG